MKIIDMGFDIEPEDQDNYHIGIIIQDSDGEQQTLDIQFSIEELVVIQENMLAFTNSYFKNIESKIEDLIAGDKDEN